MTTLKDLIDRSSKGTGDTQRMALKVPDTGLGKLPTAKVFALASKMPVFIINDRLYTLGEPGEAKENFYQPEGEKVRHNLEESATLSSLERLAMRQHAKEFNKLQEVYVQGVLEEGTLKIGDADRRYMLLDFIVNKVFPYLRGKEGDEKKLAKLLGVKFEKAAAPEPTPVKEQKEDPIINKLFKEIEKENLPGQIRKRKTKVSKLDTLLGYVPDSSEQDYTPNSILGKALGGRNAVIIKGNVYYLAPALGLPQESYVNIDGKNFILVSEEKVADLKARHDFELSKQVRIDALKVKYAEQKKIGQLKDPGTNLEALLKKKSYQEGDFGFIVKDNTSNSEGPSYWVFIQVPEHVLKTPEYKERDLNYYSREASSDFSKGKYYRFDPVKLAVRVFFAEGRLTYDSQPVTVEKYSHPFARSWAFAHICMGGYEINQLRKLNVEEAIARLLVDARKTMISGYTYGVHPIRPLYEFPNRAITWAGIKKRKLTVTNININKNV